MLVRIMFSALFAGLVAGTAVAALQAATTTPLILEAEIYEDAAGPSAARAPAVRVRGSGGAGLGPARAEAAAASTGAVEWRPGEALERTAYTTLTSVGLAFGFALVLLSAMILSGAAITARTGLMWGVAAFTAAGLAPALGLSPELPGAAAADLTARQLWWAGTTLATGAGLWLVLRVSSAPAIGAGLVLLAVPHLVGAPHPDAFTSTVPAELSARFAAASLAVQAVNWALAGAVAGYVWQRVSGEPAPA